MVLGGTHQHNDWNTNPSDEDRDFIWKGCHKLIPSLKGAKHIKDWVGLRPSRNPVRIERDRVHREGRSYEVTKWSTLYVWIILNFQL